MTGSNRRHSACKADTLPSELIPHKLVDPEGNAPSSFDYQSNVLLLYYGSNLAPLEGLEPPTSTSAKLRSNPLN